MSATCTQVVGYSESLVLAQSRPLPRSKGMVAMDDEGSRLAPQKPVGV
jgi:hypothetical protein